MADPELRLFDPTPAPRRPEKQETHSLEAVKLVEHELKTCLEGLAKRLFGAGEIRRTVDVVSSFELGIIKLFHFYFLSGIYFDSTKLPTTGWATPPTQRCLTP